MGKKLINTYGEYLKSRYHSSVYRVAVDAGFSCPHRSDDRKKGGCTYCDAYGAAAVYHRSEGYGELPDRFVTGNILNTEFTHSSVHDQVKKATEFLKTRYGAEKFILYFQSFSSTYATPEYLRALYGETLDLEEFLELVVSTRPDCIDERKADVLSDFRQRGDVWVELGLQTIHDKTLNRINRGHSFSDFKKAFAMLREKSLKVCVHIILGLPGESFRDMMESIDYLAGSGAEAVKFHNLHIPFGTSMYDEYLTGEITVPGPERYMEYLIAALERIPAEMIVERLTCDTPKIRRAAPRQFWKKTFFYDKIREEMIRRNTFQGKSFIYK
ncbi:MAG: TIGR01212 family radical SAM protein [Spirochaetales bacterium]|nr:TIGR01212 family radical SAM protein [Spirochaetales bacterium]